MYCRECGALNREGSAFCAKCGARLHTIEEKVEDSDFSYQTENESEQDKSAAPSTGTEESPIAPENAESQAVSSGKIRKKRIVIVVIILVILACLAAIAVFALKRKQAEDSFQKTVELGRRYLEEEEYEDAVDAFTEALAIDSSDASVYEGRASAYVGLASAAEEEDVDTIVDYYNRAQEDYQTAIELDEQLISGYVGLAYVYIETGDTEQAEETYAKATTVISDVYEDSQELLENAQDVYEGAIAYHVGTGNLETAGAYYDEFVRIAADIVSEEEMAEVTDLYRNWLYYDKILRYQDIYGTGKIVGYIDGLALAKLLDFNGDGQEELILAYQDAEIDESKDYMVPHYTVEIWTYDDETGMQLIYSEDASYSQTVWYLQICEVDDVYSVIQEGAFGTSSSSSYGSEWIYEWIYEEEQFEKVNSFYSLFEENDDYYEVNGTQVDKEEWIQQRDQFVDDHYSDLKYYDYYDFTYDNLNETLEETAATIDALAVKLGLTARLVEGETDTSGENILEAKLDELIAEYGVFDDNQSGTMAEYDDEWFNPYGIMSATILDFDSDGNQEMMVCIAEECDYDEEYYHITLYMWEVDNNEAILSDSMLYAAYIDYEDLMYETEVRFLTSNSYEGFLSTTIISQNGNHYIFCETYNHTRAFADGSWEGYWMIEYTGESFQYVCSFTQRGWGSSGLSYSGYAFENGTCVTSDLFYCEYEGEETPKALYETFDDAISAFFDNYDIQVTDTVHQYTNWENGETILSEQNDMTLAFEFKNIMTKSDWINVSYTFEATLTRGNELLQNYKPVSSADTSSDEDTL